MTRNIQVGITDHLDPEVEAMLMAMYSRSYVPVATRIPETAESAQQHKEKLGKFYVGYGHKSVGQLGSTTVWLEGVSQLAAKAIENHALFNGQESSTRYIDFSTQPMVSDNEEITVWQERFRAFYIKALPLVVEKIKEEYPFEENEGSYHHKEDASTQQAKKRTTWENTVKARAFDICRGLLPAGCTTNVAFHGTFDTINDHFGEMLKHPCQEMRLIAYEVLTGLKEKYQYAAMDIDKLEERNSHVDPYFFYNNITVTNPEGVHITLPDGLPMPDALMTRQKFQKVPNFISDQIRFRLSGYIDFGSFRDIHRHRNGVINMPVLTPQYGIHPFYLDNLPRDLKDECVDLMAEFTEWYKNSTEIDLYERQYCVPMGFHVAVVYHCGINQALYIMELRSGKTVHQTLRQLVQSWVQVMRNRGSNLAIHADMDEDNFTLKRGTQTFEALPELNQHPAE